MKLFIPIILSLAVVAGCKDEDVTAAIPDPQELTEEAAGHYCQMIILDHVGPKAQAHFANGMSPLWFSQARDGLAYILSPEEEAEVVVLYLNDMGTAESWDNPGTGNWIKARDAYFVLGSDAIGGMGAPEIVPFGDINKANSFAAKHGGQVMKLDQIPVEARSIADYIQFRHAGAVMKINRRRALTILAGAATLPAFGAKANATTKNWQGVALGAKVQIVLDHPNADFLLSRAVGEIRRLENIFSLYQNDSQLAQLNHDGFLDNPAFEMIELLSLCTSINARTNGAFDPTIQRLWMLYAEEFSAGKSPTDKQISHTMDMTGWNYVRVNQDRVSFSRKGIMLTLNGIAQGFIADKVTALLKSGGIENVLVNTGEISAIGVNSDGAHWQIRRGTINGPQISLDNQSIATSAPLGTTFDAGKTIGHILDPRTGKPGGLYPEVSVVSHSAALSDGLSTAFCLLSKDEIDRAKGRAKIYF